MLPTLALGLTLLAADKPIPQNVAQMEALTSERLHFNRSTLQGAYDRVGKKNPRWDAFAREALELTARRASSRTEDDLSKADLHRSAKRAIDAGCDDPLILFFYGVTSKDENFPGYPEYQKRLRVAADAMKSSGYPPIRRAIAQLERVLADTWKANPTEGVRRDAELGLDAVLDLLPSSLAQDPRGVEWDTRWFAICEDTINTLRRLSGDDQRAFEWTDARLAKVKGAEALRMAVKGASHLHWGWRTRGTGTADKVSEEQFRLFGERLAVARDALEAAWAMNPVGITVPNLMLTIEKGTGGGDRAAMELWFDRAMRANMNDQEACWSKLEWLDPKWYGDEQGEQMVAFGRQCIATGNAQARIMLLGVSAHYRRFWRMDAADWGDYQKRPDVWADFAKVYPSHLKAFPRDHVSRSRYAMACYVSDHSREAREQFKILGDNLTEWGAVPKWSLEELKKARAEVEESMSGQKQ